MTPDPAGALEGHPSSDAEVSRRLTFVIVGAALFMSSVDSTIVATALPAIHRSLHATINWAGWTITIYGLGNVVVLPIAGKVSDQFGRRRVFLFGVALFTVASGFCGLATDIYVLIVFRALQAVGGAALLPSATGVVSDHFGQDRDRAIGMFGTFFAAGQVVGPVLGGILVSYLSWRWIFFVNLPVGVAIFAGIVKYIPASPGDGRERMDLRGLVLMGSGLFAATFAITSLGGRHTSVVAPVVVAPMAAAVVLLYLFLRHTNRATDPFIAMRLLRSKGFAVMNVLNTLWGAAAVGALTLIPLYAEERYHFTALKAGTLLTARGVGVIVIGSLAAMALRRTGYRLPLVVGFSVAAAGTSLMGFRPSLGTSPYAWLSIGAAISGLGSGVANPAARNACLQIAPDEVAAISGLRQMFVYLGTIFAVAIITAVLNRSSDPALAQAHVFWVVAGVLAFVMVPLVGRVAEHKGSW